MDAHQVCEMLIMKVKSSDLKFIIEESPFSVNISLEKSFIQKRNGGNLPKRSNLLDEAAANRSLAKENTALKESLDRLNLEREALEETVSELSYKLEKSKVEICDLFGENKYKTKENVELEKEVDKAKDLSEKLTFEIDTVEEKHKINLNAKNDEIKKLANTSVYFLFLGSLLKRSCLHKPAGLVDQLMDT